MWITINHITIGAINKQSESHSECHVIWLVFLQDYAGSQQKVRRRKHEKITKLKVQTHKLFHKIKVLLFSVWVRHKFRLLSCSLLSFHDIYMRQCLPAPNPPCQIAYVRNIIIGTEYKKNVSSLLAIERV